MTVADKLAYLAETKELIRAAINARGGRVAATDAFRIYADAIYDLPLGSADADYSPLRVEAVERLRMSDIPYSVRHSFASDVVLRDYAEIDFSPLRVEAVERLWMSDNGVTSLSRFASDVVLRDYVEIAFSSPLRVEAVEHVALRDYAEVESVI
jgi:hypothetical protein